MELMLQAVLMFPSLAYPLFQESFDAMSALVDDHDELSFVSADLFEWHGDLKKAGLICLSRGSKSVESCCFF
jgi:hypothetical protein